MPSLKFSLKSSNPSTTCCRRRPDGFSEMLARGINAGCGTIWTPTLGGCRGLCCGMPSKSSRRRSGKVILMLRRWLDDAAPYCTIHRLASTKNSNGIAKACFDWYLKNHDKVKEFWLRVNRAAKPFPGVIGYVDAVEVALCFGWIDSTLKSIDSGKSVQHIALRLASNHRPGKECRIPQYKHAVGTTKLAAWQTHSRGGSGRRRTCRIWQADN